MSKPVPMPTSMAEIKIASLQARVEKTEAALARLQGMIEHIRQLPLYVQDVGCMVADPSGEWIFAGDLNAVLWPRPADGSKETR